MDGEPGIAKQYKYLYWCVCKNDRGKMVENGEKGKKVVFFFLCVCVCVCPGWPDHECVEKHTF